MPKMHLRQLGFMYSTCGSFLKTKKEYKNLRKQDIQNKFIKKNQIRFAFNMTWFMEILRICLEEEFLIKN